MNWTMTMLLAAAAFPAAAHAQAEMGLPSEPKALAIACSATAMTELYRIEEEGQSPILGKDATTMAARAWVDRAAALSGTDAATLMQGTIATETEKLLDMPAASFGLRLSWCVRHPPQ